MYLCSRLKMIVIIILNLFFALNECSLSDKYERIHYWNLFGYDIDGIIYTSDADYELKEGTILFSDPVDEKDKFLIRKNLVPNHVTVNKRFSLISIPKTRPGIPFSLNFVDRDDNNKSPLLKPFPTTERSKVIISVYETTEDICGGIWFVDTGFVDVPGIRSQAAPPCIYMYEFRKNAISIRNEIPPQFLKDGVSAGLRSLTVDQSYPCHATYLYISDDNGNALITYHRKTNLYTRIERQGSRKAWTFPVPESIVRYAINIILNNNTPTQSFEKYTDYVKTNEISQRGDRDVTVNLSSRNTSPRGVIFDRNYISNTLLYTNEDRTKLFCSNMETDLSEENIVPLTDISPKNDFYISGLSTYGTTFYFMVNKLRNLTNEIYDENEINFAEYRIEFDVMMNNTKCNEPTANFNYYKNWRKKIEELFGMQKYLVKYVPDEYVQYAKKTYQYLLHIVGNNTNMSRVEHINDIILNTQIVYRGLGSNKTEIKIISLKR